MSDPLSKRLDQILPKLISEGFLSGRGIGNEIAFYVFDYPPEEELTVRKHIEFLVQHLPRHRRDLRIKHINLFDFVIGHLQQRELLDKALELARKKGDDFLLRQLKKILDPSKFAAAFAEAAQPSQHDLVFVSGVGSVYPLLRTHSLLNNLHSVMGQTPLVLFYPGRYDGQSLRLFGRLKNDNYYRAFKLVP
jgi:hypothetical protein